ncbi:hypothetical protein RN001_010475 [Aquatica leii]|uniref:RING-type domain-containing protein n=1 Tax=Aquatica leii TaxID=1421715 RepID=A0AAN7PUW2_9COLE|nr:hypothetical protein RN001_010475 [Aquatica leii]
MSIYGKCKLYILRNLAMAPGVQKRMTARQILLKDLNQFLTCTLCRGYLIDATTLVDCLHVFCRACILRYFENFKLGCPTCNVVYKKKNNSCFRSDPIIQALVYKLVPGLYNKEVQRREDFYRSTGVRASSSCSEDSVLGDLNEEHEEWVLSTCGDQNQYLSPDDAISLSLEYYKPHLDTTQNSPSDTKSTNYQDSTKQSDEKSTSDLNNSANLSAEKTRDCDNNNVGVENDSDNKNIQCPLLLTNVTSASESFDEFSDKKKCDRRYLQCPAAVTMSLLQKFLRMKNALSAEHRVDIIYSGEVLPQHFSLMDVAYTFKWKRTKPMRFFYRIFIPAKIQPIKIISSGKQLQVVPATSGPRIESTKDALDAETHKNKERLMANLELQKKQNGGKEENCIFEYQEPDKDEIREFAEKRDREWALQKKLDEEKEKHRNSKKRKKNKHSKSNLLYKKRKLHAEITSSESLQKEESLKLKVKLTPHNGYKHKHHKSSQLSPIAEVPKVVEMSSKEKLLQMRQVRHKHISMEDKVAKTVLPSPCLEETPVECATETDDVPPSNSNLSPKANQTKEICMQKYPTVQLERNEQTERHAQKTFLKTFQSYTEKFVEQNRPPTQNTYPGKNSQGQITKSLEQKIADLHQQYTTVEPAKPEAPKVEKKVNFSPNVTTYPSGFTVSKVEAGGKRKQENEANVHDKRPSLEITLINPPEKPKPELKPITKRPPPPTIPLERIKKSMNRVPGVSILPKIPEKCDNSGALDLSKPNRSAEMMTDMHKVLNGLGKSPERVRTPDGNIQLSNLQMLSKVATEHSNIKTGLNLNKRLPVPNLQTLKIPVLQNATAKSNLAKLPKLNEINRTQFRMPNTQMRNMRPNQNQSIRNIPNPSLLVRQQTQNRLNSLNNATSATSDIKDVTKQATEPTNGETKSEDKSKLTPDSSTIPS